MKKYSWIVKCEICWNDMNYYTSWKDRRYNTSQKEYDLYKCIYCKSEQIYPMPSKQEQFWMYPKTYYSYAWDSETDKRGFLQKIASATLGIFSSLLSFKYWNKYTIQKGWFDSFIEKKLLHKNIFSVLDIWCWTNATKKDFWNKWERSWFEVSDSIKQVGDISYAPSIWEIWFDKKFDAIISIHVLEHVDTPHMFFEKIHDLLSNDWYVLIKLPSCDWVLNRILWKYAWERDIPRHLFNYSKNWLLKLAEESNFEVIDCRYLSNYWTSISLFWRLWKWNVYMFWKLVWFVLGFIDVIISFLPFKTNQLGIILKKHA